MTDRTWELQLHAARDRAIAALLSIGTAELLGAACPGIGPHADPHDWHVPDAEEHLCEMLANRVRATRRELLDLVAGLVPRYGRATIAAALDLPIIAIDGMLDELVDHQARDLRGAERLAYLFTPPPEDRP